MIFSNVSALCLGNLKIIVNSFGAENIPEYLDTSDINKLEIPKRDDGAIFQGWYYSLNFDKSFKVDFSKKLEYIIINAKYDKCYCFSLRDGLVGYFGKKSDNVINYYIPNGSYNVELTELSKANKGFMVIYRSDKTMEMIDFNEINEEKSIVINEGDYVTISKDTVFLFQRDDVDRKYIDFNIE